MDINAAKSIATFYGYTLLDNEWKGVKFKYTFLSYYGFKWSCSFDNFKNNKRCPRDKNVKFFLEIIKPTFESKGYVILLDPKDYIDQFQVFYFKCDLGLIYETCWNNVSRGIFNTFDSKYAAYKELKSYVKLKGGRLLQPWYEYKGVDIPLRFKCGNKHISYISLTAARSKIWCKHCFIEAKKKFMVNDNDLALYNTTSIKLAQYNENTYTIKGNHGLELLGVECKECGKVFHPGRRKVYERLASLQVKRRGNSYFYCSYTCKHKNKYYNNLKESSFEKNVLNYVLTFFSGIIERNNRSLIKNYLTNKYLELDFYFPELNKAIECNGVYWHSKDVVIKRDRLKENICEDKNINLLVIQEDLWYSNIDLQKDIIYKFLT